MTATSLPIANVWNAQPDLARDLMTAHRAKRQETVVRLSDEAMSQSAEIRAIIASDPASINPTTGMYDGLVDVALHWARYFVLLAAVGPAVLAGIWLSGKSMSVEDVCLFLFATTLAAFVLSYAARVAGMVRLTGNELVLDRALHRNARSVWALTDKGVILSAAPGQEPETRSYDLDELELRQTIDAHGRALELWTIEGAQIETMERPLSLLSREGSGIDALIAALSAQR